MKRVRGKEVYKTDSSSETRSRRGGGFQLAAEEKSTEKGTSRKWHLSNGEFEEFFRI